MGTARSELTRKLKTISLAPGIVYVDAHYILKLYKSLPKKRKHTIKKMIRELKLDDILTVQLFDESTQTKQLSFVERVKSMFRKPNYLYYIELDEFLNPKEGRHKAAHIHLLDAILSGPDSYFK
jgi:hypothetical protein